jgi:putative alpha-1,2-mannosidase
MGFYPVNPASGEYLLTAPLFDQVILKSGAKPFTILTRRTSAKAVYIQAVRWNGLPYSKNYISWQMIRQGGTLEISLSDQPGAWGASENARPFSLTTN